MEEETTHAKQETTKLDGQAEARDHRGSAQNGDERERGVSASRSLSGSVLRVGEESSDGCERSTAGSQTRSKGSRPRGDSGKGTDAHARGGGGAKRRKPSTKKGVLAVEPGRRYDASIKSEILETVRLTRERTKETTIETLEQLGLSRSRYYRWRRRAAENSLNDQQPSGRTELRPTPREAAAVRAFSLEQPTMGYKRLASMMIDNDTAYLSPYWVLQILSDAGLIRTRKAIIPEALKRPAAPTKPDEQWHIDLMYLRVQGRWYYLIDIIDAFSRYLVHWSLKPTMHAECVTQTVQEALESLPEAHGALMATPPKIVHDNGIQFVSQEWRSLVEGAGFKDIATRVAHPQSNGLVERVHRTHREEAFAIEPESYYDALDLMANHVAFYNLERPHSSIKFPRPFDFYRGNPEARLEERRQKLAKAKSQREEFWNEKAS